MSSFPCDGPNHPAHAPSLAGRSLPPDGFNLSEPVLKRLSPEKNPSADSHGWEVWDASNFALDNIAEMGSRTSEERGSLGQIQDIGHTCVFGLLDGAFRFVKVLSKGCYRMRGSGRHTVLSFLRTLRRRTPKKAVPCRTVSGISSAPANAADVPPLFRSTARLVGFIPSYMACPVFSQMDQT